MSWRNERSRLDQLLVARGLYTTRSRARDAIARGTVTVDGRPARRSGMMCAADAAITIDDPAQRYVSRAALKLKAAIEAFDVPVVGAVCLDLGASTGGFSQVLLEAGAARIHAVDVGRDQLDGSLRADPRIHLIESLNTRDLTADHLGGERPSVIVCDVSFISLKLALPPALDLAAPGAHLTALIKPQFEVGREKVGKGGLVDEGDARSAADDLSQWLEGQPRWRVRDRIASPITGGDGNREFLVWASKS